MTNRQIRWWYARYNKKYFGGRLPKVHLRFERLSPSTRHIVFGVTTYVGKPPEILISLAAEFQHHSRITKHTLLHEMAHVSLPQTVMHGPKWEARMRKLARQGAFTGVW